MPKIRMTDRQIQDALLRQAIKGSAGYFMLNADEQASIAGCTRATWYRRLNRPGTFTLNELRAMTWKYHWSAQTVAAFLGVREERAWDI